MKTKIMTRILGSALLTQLVLLPDFVYSQSDFYRGKTITIIHGRSAGGSGDYRARAVAPFLQKYIPGNPTIVHEHMGTVVAAARRPIISSTPLVPTV
jgi:tripartite-type tricarboxylate transporter receptor subunit TctC